MVLGVFMGQNMGVRRISRILRWLGDRPGGRGASIGVGNEMAQVALQQVEVDAALVGAVARGDGEALAEFVGRNERWVRGVVYATLGDVNILDDVMQKVWLTVWQRAKQMEDVRCWRHWLYRMARNAAIDAGRRKQRRRKLLQGVGLQLLGGGWRRRERTPAAELALRETHRRVLEAIGQMPEIYREPFVLRHLEGWSYQQIAETLGMPIDTVGTRLVRARRRLQEALSQEQI
jgi:RNA polymerase sigma-70 factor, ECF subfamily